MSHVSARPKSKSTNPVSALSYIISYSKVPLRERARACPVLETGVRVNPCQRVQLPLLGNFSPRPLSKCTPILGHRSVPLRRSLDSGFRRSDAFLVWCSLLQPQLYSPSLLAVFENSRCSCIGESRGPAYLHPWMCPSDERVGHDMSCPYVIPYSYAEDE